MRRTRNPLVVGAVGLTVLVCLVYAAFHAHELPIIGGGTTYVAQFSEAGGLRVDDEVRIAGVKVGSVEAVELAGDHVRVTFRLEKDAPRIGTRTRASIRVKTLLGRVYLALEPAGPGQLAPDEEIPLSRTVAPYDVVDAFSDLAVTSERIDTAQLARALDTLSATFADTAPEVRGTLEGLSRLSRTIASRDAQLRTLLARANTVSKVLAARDEQIARLIRDGDLLLRELHARRELIHQLLVTTQELAVQITGLVRDNRAELEPALRHLAAVVELLRRNQRDLDRSIELLAPFVRVFANTLGTGPWFDTYIPNLAPLPAVPRLPGDDDPDVPRLPRPNRHTGGGR